MVNYPLVSLGIVRGILDTVTISYPRGLAGTVEFLLWADAILAREVGVPRWEGELPPVGGGNSFFPDSPEHRSLVAGYRRLEDFLPDLFLYPGWPGEGGEMDVGYTHLEDTVRSLGYWLFGPDPVNG